MYACMVNSCVKKKFIKLECQRCGHVWTYKGKREYTALCPNCNTHVSIKKHIVHEEKVVKQALSKPASLAQSSGYEGGA